MVIRFPLGQINFVAGINISLHKIGTEDFPLPLCLRKTCCSFSPDVSFSIPQLTRMPTASNKILNQAILSIMLLPPPLQNHLCSRPWRMILSLISLTVLLGDFSGKRAYRQRHQKAFLWCFFPVEQIDGVGNLLS